MGTGYLNKKHPAKVLLIYTGGTLGMRPRDDGAYAPDSSFLSEVLSEMPEMKDPMMPEVDVHALGDPLDSSDVEFEHWIRFAVTSRQRCSERERERESVCVCALFLLVVE